MTIGPARVGHAGAWLAAHAPVGLAHLDLEGRCTAANARLHALLGLSDGAAAGLGWTAMLHPEDHPGDPATWLAEAAAAGSRPVRVLAADGPGRTVLLRLAAVEGGYAAAVDEVAPPEQAGGTSMFAEILETTTDLVAVVDHLGVPEFLNAAGRNLVGILDPSEVGHLRIGDLYTDAAREVFELEAIPEALRFGMWVGELALRRPDGSEIPVLQEMVYRVDPETGADRFSLIARDISERKLLEEAMAHRATHDALTGLPNRALLGDRLVQAIARLERRPGSVGLLYLDLDGFKGLNDTLGHEAGDVALVEVAVRLRDALRATDTAARLGGDEFVVLLEDVGGVQEAVAVAERIGADLRRPVLGPGGQLVQLDSSIGVAVATTPLADVQVLLRLADSAMYAAKQAGKGRVVLGDVLRGG
jgi:diguanylate cyclase (GGDEF)-like protein/PAS domain S-box-containing protein